MFAAAALQGLLAGEVLVPDEMSEDEAAAFVARAALRLADATLAELSKTPPPARTKETPRPPTDPGESEAGEPKGVADRLRESVEAGGTPAPLTVGNGGAAEQPTSPVSVWDCEARFEHDPVCPGPAVFDPVSKGRFCGLHAQIPEGHRREMHRLHGFRNRPLAPVARLAG